MSARPDVSVVVTNYNYGRFLEAAVESARSQQGCVVEVIVVDDGSTDESAEVLDRLPASCVVQRQPNGGQGSAFNAGFGVATAPVVMFLDADDLLEPGIAARCANAIRDDPTVAKVQFSMRTIDASGRPLISTIPRDPRRIARGDLRQAVMESPDDLVWQPTSGNAFAASVLEQILPMPEAPYRISADHYLSNCAALFGRVAVVEGLGASYRVHSDNHDYRDQFDLERVREIVKRTIVTHSEIARLASKHCMASRGGPREVESLTFVANRLVSLRLDPDRHPVPGDSVWRLVRAGLHAARVRFDVGRVRRWQYAVWFPAVAVAPRTWVEKLATRALQG